MESDRRLNRWGLTFTPAVINRLRKAAIYGQPQLSLEHQGRAKRYVVRGVESGGATEEVGYYVTFAGESGKCVAKLMEGPRAIIPKRAAIKSYAVREFAGFIWLLWKA